MRIDFSQPWLGSDGNVIAEGTTLDRMEAPGRVGRFSSRTFFTNDGVSRSGGPDAAWIGRGEFPEFPGILLSDTHLTITASRARDDEGKLAPVFRKWVTFARDDILEDISSGPSAYVPDVRVGPDGLVGICSDIGVSFLHFGTGIADFISPQDNEAFQSILDPDALSWASTGAFGSSSDAPIRVDFHRSESSTLAVVGCVGGDVLVWYATDSNPLLRLATDPVLSPPLPIGGEITDLRILPSGQIFACGTRPSAGFGTRVWYASTDTRPDPEAVSAGVSWTLTELDDQTIGDDPRIDISPLQVPFVVLNRVILSVDDLATGDPNFRHGVLDDSVDFGQFQDLPPVGPLRRIRFDRGFLVVLQELDSAFGTGSFVHVLDGGLTKVLWRRRFNTAVTELSASPNAVPGSVPVYPGRTPDPLSGIGPDGVP